MGVCVWWKRREGNDTRNKVQLACVLRTHRVNAFVWVYYLCVSYCSVCGVCGVCVCVCVCVCRGVHPPAIVSLKTRQQTLPVDQLL